MASSSRFVVVMGMLALALLLLLLQPARGRDDPLPSSPSATVVPHIKMVNSSSSSSSRNDYCHYDIEVRTSDYESSGTDSTMFFDLYDKYGNGIHFSQNGAAERFERSRIDSISYDGPCIQACNLVVTSDGTGEYPDWCCDWVWVFAAGETSMPTSIDFRVDQCIGPGKPTMQFQRWYC